MLTSLVLGTVLGIFAQAPPVDFFESATEGAADDLPYPERLNFVLVE